LATLLLFLDGFLFVDADPEEFLVQTVIRARRLLGFYSELGLAVQLDLRVSTGKPLPC